MRRIWYQNHYIIAAMVDSPGQLLSEEIFLRLAE